MAYAFTATVTMLRHQVGGRRVWRVVIAETECAAASEWSVAHADADGGVPLPSEGTITSYDAVITGTGTTLQPILSDTTNPASTQVGYIGAQSAAAASVHDRSNVRYQGLTTLYGRSRPNAGADNTVTTELVVVEGHI